MEGVEPAVMEIFTQQQYPAQDGFDAAKSQKRHPRRCTNVGPKDLTAILAEAMDCGRPFLKAPPPAQTTCDYGFGAWPRSAD